MANRPNRDTYYMNIALGVAQRATCLRRRYGAVIVKDDRIVSTGYCGAVKGATDCLERGKCKREELGIPSGERYELCRSVHAEQNAIISASKEEMKDAIIYVNGIDKNAQMVSGKPCDLCTRMIINAGIRTVVCSSHGFFGPTIKNAEIYDVKDDLLRRINEDEN